MTCTPEPSPPEAKLLKAKPGKTMKGIARAALLGAFLSACSPSPQPAAPSSPGQVPLTAFKNFYASPAARRFEVLHVGTLERSMVR
jgi:hypothetical protein